MCTGKFKYDKNAYSSLQYIQVGVLMTGLVYYDLFTATSDVWDANSVVYVRLVTPVSD